MASIEMLISNVIKICRKHKDEKMIRKIWNIVTAVLVAAIAIFAILLVGARLFGIQVYAVISGSMEPNYPVGSLIYVKKAEPEEIKVNDVITFVLPNEMPATHRVIEIDNKNEYFKTKGDNNEEADGSPVHFKNLIGKPIFCIPYIGYAAHYIQNPPGIYIAVACGAILLILVFLPDIFKDNKKKKEKNTQ